MFTVTPVGLPGGDCYLLCADETAILAESGFPCSADVTVENIRRVIGGRKLTHIFLSHSHYDHAGGAARIREAFPGAQIVASTTVASIFAKPSARAAMVGLSAAAAQEHGLSADDDAAILDAFSVDIPVVEGDMVDAGFMKFRVIGTPGHTRCSVSYFCEESGLLIASETTGIINAPPTAYPCYIISHAMTQEAIAKCAALKPKAIVVPHWGLIEGADAEAFLESAAVEAQKLYDYILERHDRGLDVEGIVVEYKKDYYTPEVARCQPEKAFYTNAYALIPRMLKEAGRIE